MPLPVMPEPNAHNIVGRGTKITIEASEEMTRSVLRDHGGPDIIGLQKQIENGRVELAALEAAWTGQRTEILRWISGMFDYFMLKDEWFLATVALLDRAEVARPRFSARKSLKVDSLTAVLATLKVLGMQALFDGGTKKYVLRLARDVSGGTIWDEVVEAELRLYHLLNFRVCVPTVDELAVRIAMEVGLLARDTCADWPGLKHMRIAMPRHELSIPQPCFVMLLYYIIELCVVHKPDVIYQDSSAGVVALAALHLALQQFENVPAKCTSLLREQEQHILKVGEAVQVSKTMANMAQLWKEPPQNSEVVRKWRGRLLGSGETIRTFKLLHPSSGVVGNVEEDVPVLLSSPEDTANSGESQDSAPGKDLSELSEAGVGSCTLSGTPCKAGEAQVKSTGVKGSLSHQLSAYSNVLEAPRKRGRNGYDRKSEGRSREPWQSSKSMATGPFEVTRGKWCVLHCESFNHPLTISMLLVKTQPDHLSIKVQC